MKEIIIRIKNPYRESEHSIWEGENKFEITIDGEVIHQVKRFAIDIDDTNLQNNDVFSDVIYTLEKRLNKNEVFYDSTDTVKEPEDWYNVKNG